MNGKRLTARVLAAGALCGLALRAVTVHSVGAAPQLLRVVVSNNDLDAVQGMAVPGSTVEVWYRQRSFREGDAQGFSWCAWKNGGAPVLLGTAHTGSDGIWRLHGLASLSTVMLFPGVPSGDTCAGGVYTEILPRTCDAQGCTAWNVPTVRWLNVRRASGLGTASASISGAERTALAVADGPDDGPAPASVYDVDEDAIDTTLPGFDPGQKVTWKCGSGGTAVCPSVVIHDASTITVADPEFPFVLGTLQGHAPGGSVFAAAAIDRPGPLGFTVNVNVRIKADLDVDLGCDQPKHFDFSPF